VKVTSSSWIRFQSLVSPSKPGMPISCCLWTSVSGSAVPRATIMLFCKTIMVVSRL